MLMLLLCCNPSTHDSCALWCIDPSNNWYNGPHICQTSGSFGLAWCSSATTTCSIGQWEVLALSLCCSSNLIPRSLQAYGSYDMGPPQISFCFRVEPPAHFIMMFAFYFQVPMLVPVSPMGAQGWSLNYCNPLEYTHGRHMLLLVLVHWPYQECTE